MKCYWMHEDLGITSTIDGHHPTANAVTIYRGFAVCREHLEELKLVEKPDPVWMADEEDGVSVPGQWKGESFKDYGRRVGR